MEEGSEGDRGINPKVGRVAWDGEGKRGSAKGLNTAVAQPWPSPPHFVVKAKALDIVPDG